MQIHAEYILYSHVIKSHDSDTAHQIIYFATNALVELQNLEIKVLLKHEFIQPYLRLFCMSAKNAQIRAE